VKPAKLEPVVKAQKAVKSSISIDTTVAPKERPTTTRREDLAIFDFTESSPNHSKVKEITSKGSSLRRHSTISGEKRPAPREAEEKKSSVSRGSRSTSTRRKSMMV
jgi:hypothetical protein